MVMPRIQRESGHLHDAGGEMVAEGVEHDSCDESAEHVDEIVGLDIDRGTTEEEVEGQGAEEERVAVLPKQNHQHGAGSHVRRGEGRRRAFSRSLGGFHKVAEETVRTGDVASSVW